MTQPKGARPSGNGSKPPGGAGGPKKTTPARIQGMPARGGGPPWMGAGMPAEKPMTFWPSAKRLMRRLSPYRARLIAIVALGVSSVFLSVTVPKILGRATDVLFAGVVGKQLPAGTTKQQAIDGALKSDLCVQRATDIEQKGRDGHGAL